MKNLIIISFIVLLNSCVGDRFEEFRPNFFIDVTYDNSEIMDIINISIDTYINNYGECNTNVYISPRKWAFECSGQLVGGCAWGNIISVGVHPTSSCMTMYVIMHEMTHACRYFEDADSWEEPLWLITYAMNSLGKCIYGENEIYQNYIWE